MAWSWFSRRTPQRRRGLLRIQPSNAAAKRRRRSAPLGVRRLERRRVLDAAITSFTPMVMDGTATVPEGEVTATATATGQGTLFFTWTLTKDGDLFASTQQSAMSNQPVNFTFFLPDDNNEGQELPNYELRLRVVDSFQNAASMDPTTLAVRNVAPLIENLMASDVAEGGATMLIGNYHDPGTGDMHSLDIDWDGDGTFDDFGVPVSGGTFSIPHVYPDDDPETGTPEDMIVINVRITDDDGDSSEESTSVLVSNVVPELEVYDADANPITLFEGDTLDLSGMIGAPSVGTFSDIGTLDTHTARIDWGDGVVQDALLSESGGAGTIVGTHLYADNDADNLYTIIVRLADDDQKGDFAAGVAGVDFVEAQFTITVRNVNPTLNPITATDVEPSGRTTLNLMFSDPGADTFRVLVNWGDRLGLPSEDQFVVAAVHDGPTPVSMTLEHFYSGPPDPLHPTADITITVKIFDDDQLTEGIIEDGISDPMFATISNPGIVEHMAAIDTTPDVHRLEFAPPAEAEVFVAQQVATARSQQSARISVGGGELAATAQRYLQLCMIRPDGRPEKCFRIKDEALFDLRGLFARLPDGRYHVLLVRTENNTQRKVIEVDVRRGKLVETWDDSEGTRDRPPTSESAAGGPIGDAVPLEQNPLLEPLPDQGHLDQTTTDDDVTCNCDGEQIAPAPKPADITGSPESAPDSTPLTELGLAGLGLVSAGGWSRRVDAALEQAGRRDWQRLRRAGRTGRFLHRAG